MPFAVFQTVAPVDSPVSLATAKEHLRVVGTDEDTLIQAYLDGAVADAQRESGLQFCRATFQLLLDDFPRCYEADGSRLGTIRIPLFPVASVDSVEYSDPANDPQTASTDDYQVGLRTGRIVPVNWWPGTNLAPENVAITFKAGWADAASIPADIKNAILLILGDRYENRGDGIEQDRDIPPAAKRLLNNVREVF